MVFRTDRLVLHRPGPDVYAAVQQLFLGLSPPQTPCWLLGDLVVSAVQQGFQDGKEGPWECAPGSRTQEKLHLLSGSLLPRLVSPFHSLSDGRCAQCLSLELLQPLINGSSSTSKHCASAHSRASEVGPGEVHAATRRGSFHLGPAWVTECPAHQLDCCLCPVASSRPHW